MSTADLLYSDTDEQLRSAVRALLADLVPSAAVAAAYDEPVDITEPWQALARDLGLAGLLVPEELGGAGAGAREAGVVAEEIGRAVAPLPFLTSAVLATVALREAGERDVLTALAAGTDTATLVVPLSTMTLARPTVEAGPAGLYGTVTTVAGAVEANVLVVPVGGADGMELHVVERNAQGVSVTPVPSLDMSRPVADVSFHAVASQCVATTRAADAVAGALLAGAVVLASEQAGVAGWCFETTVAYVKERKQFGRAIGSYQAIKHRLADVWLQTNQAGAVARYAADAHARGDDVLVAASLAQAYCGPVAVHAAEECVQLHGGVGMTWEYPPHLYLKRAKADELALGGAHAHRARLGALVDLPAA